VAIRNHFGTFGEVIAVAVNTNMHGAPDGTVRVLRWLDPRARHSGACMLLLCLVCGGVWKQKAVVEFRHPGMAMQAMKCEDVIMGNRFITVGWGPVCLQVGLWFVCECVCVCV
jgi:hypothetical protein